MFDWLIHADWSVTANKRWMAIAQRERAGWFVGAPLPVGDTANFLDTVFSAAIAGRRILIGFDFPIGVPVAYGDRIEFDNFRDLLNSLGEGAWARFFDVAATPSEIAIVRPFYPAIPKKGVSRADLAAGLGVQSFDDLFRICEHRTLNRRAACSLFWTLGGNQVGKGALSGWKEVIRPALRRGAHLWPFDGTLASFTHVPGVVLAETYPAEAYYMVNAAFLLGQSKRRQADRKSKSSAVLAWAERHAIDFSEAASFAVNDGFGSRSNGEDKFDAFMGLLKMIEVVDGRRAERTTPPDRGAAWEGWILGR
jgi:hypothetical protein